MATLTVYPSLDGFVDQGYGLGSGQLWSTVRNAAGSLARSGDATDYAIYIQSDNATDQWETLGRSIFVFDTSSLGSGSTINSATISFYGISKQDQLAISPDINVYVATPASDTSLVASDYTQIGTTAFSTAITYGNFLLNSYNDFALNSSGLANISKTGNSRFGLRNAASDVTNAAPPWSNYLISSISISMSETVGTSQDPKLVIDYTPATTTSTTTTTSTSSTSSSTTKTDTTTTTSTTTTSSSTSSTSTSSTSSSTTTTSSSTSSTSSSTSSTSSSTTMAFSIAVDSG